MRRYVNLTHYALNLKKNRHRKIEKVKNLYMQYKT